MENRPRILFFGFSDVGYRCLKLLLDKGCDVIGVFTHDADPHEAHWFQTPESLAKENFIRVFKPDTLKTEKWFRKVRYMKPDLILSLYYRNFIPEEIFSLARLGAYNMHGSYLPAYRGRAPLNWSIINGENHCGVTLHTIEKKFDAGEIVDREKVAFGPDEYVGDIQPRVSAAAVRVLERSLPSLLAGAPRLEKQDESKASYFGKRTPEDGRIDFSKSAREVFNLVRGVSRPFPGAFAEIGGRRYTIWRAKPLEDFKGHRAGEIVSREPFIIACGKGALEISECDESPARE